MSVLCCRLMHRSKPTSYSITSSARASRAGGTSMPSVLAVLRLTTNSYLVGACTGKSALRHRWVNRRLWEATAMERAAAPSFLLT